MKIKRAMIEDRPYQETKRSRTELMPGLLKELWEFKHLFEERELKAMLPDYKSWDLKIKIKNGMTIKLQKMRQFNQTKLEELKKFINMYLPKQYIQKSESEYRCNLLFMLKKDGTIQSYIDFRPINKATVKN
jgi:oligoribonuclease (3'-5' exoribonuclease)